MRGSFPYHFRWKDYAQLLSAGRQGARCAYLCRDPRDIAVSAWLYRRDVSGKSGGELARAASELKAFGSQTESLRDFMRHGDRYGFAPFAEFAADMKFFYRLPGNYVLKYEQLSADPVNTVRNFLEFLGYPFDIEKIEAVVRSVSRTGQMGRWISVFDDETEALFKELAGDVVSVLGYESNEEWTYRDAGTVAAARAIDSEKSVRVSSEAIEWCYRIFFERNIESRDTLNHHFRRFKEATLGDLRRAFLHSEEYRRKFTDRDKS